MKQGCFRTETTADSNLKNIIFYHSPLAMKQIGFRAVVLLGECFFFAGVRFLRNCDFGIDCFWLFFLLLSLSPSPNSHFQAAWASGPVKARRTKSRWERRPIFCTKNQWDSIPRRVLLYESKIKFQHFTSVCHQSWLPPLFLNGHSKMGINRKTKPQTVFSWSCVYVCSEKPLPNIKCAKWRWIGQDLIQSLHINGLLFALAPFPSPSLSLLGREGINLVERAH